MMHELRYATHLGFRSAELPLFPHAAGGLDPIAHIALAARLGFHGVLYPWALSRPATEVTGVAQALARDHLECGCVVYGPRDLLTTPLWGEPGPETRGAILEYVRNASALASRLGSKTLAILAAASPERSTVAQFHTMADHLRAAVDVASSFGVVIGIEPMIVLPNMLLKGCADAQELMALVDHPGVQIIFDTAHVQMMDGDVVDWFDRLYQDVCSLQLADQPGRVEPGAGTIDFVGLLEIAIRRRFRGLVELEHFWSEPGIAGEEAGLARIRVIDAAAQARRSWADAVAEYDHREGALRV